MKRAEKELLIYTVTSAAGLRNEPKIYGELRLMECAKRLCALMREDASEEEKAELGELEALISKDLDKCMTAKDEFRGMIDEAVLKLVDL